MKSSILIETLIGWTAIACAVVVFVASALDPPDEAATARPVPSFPADLGR